MPNTPLYPQNYSGFGAFAILCEGDLPGYEAAILGRWLRERTPTKEIVDVRPCGTGGALLGMADAIGRSVRVIVIEDRDFRSAERAKTECAKKCAERDERNLAMRGWVAWSRNEIENYFLDDEVLFPAMREAFECTDADTKAARDEAINALRVFQVVQAAVSEADAGWAKLEASRRVGGGRPRWSGTGLAVPVATAVRTNLETHVKVWQDKVCTDGAFKEPFLGRSLLDAFDTRLAAWSVDPLPVDVWKRDWAGKELLKLVRQQLAAKFRAPIASKQTRIDKVDWFSVGKEVAETDAAKKTKIQEQLRGALDRDIERAIQPVLVQHLWAHLTAEATADMNLDFGEIAKCFIK
jgi:hypothetical protein